MSDWWPSSVNRKKRSITRVHTLNSACDERRRWLKVLNGQMADQVGLQESRGFLSFFFFFVTPLVGSRSCRQSTAWKSIGSGWYATWAGFLCRRGYLEKKQAGQRLWGDPLSNLSAAFRKIEATSLKNLQSDRVIEFGQEIKFGQRCTTFLFLQPLGYLIL